MSLLGALVVSAAAPREGSAQASDSGQTRVRTATASLNRLPAPLGCQPGTRPVELDSRTSFGALSGRRINSVSITTAPPDVEAAPAHEWLGRLRATTLTGTVSRQVLFAPGDTVDTLRVGETVRRLRDERIFDDVVLTAWECANPTDTSAAAERAAADSDVDITVHTRDAWTLQPTAVYVAPVGLTLGFLDRDVLGTGKTVGLTELESSVGRGGSVTLVDPWVLGSGFVGGVRLADLGRIHQFSATFRTHLLTIDQPWVVEAVTSKWVRENKVRDTSTEAVDASFRVGRIVEASADVVARLYVGVELDSLATMAAIDSGVLTSPRRFFGLDLGLQRQSALYDTLSWLVPGRGLLDIPIGTEGDGLIAIGENSAAPGYPSAGRYDLWVGRMWLPRHGTLFAADAWTSGFVGGDLLPDRVIRFAGSGYQYAPNGYWGGRFLHEDLIDAELDVRLRALVTEVTDPTLTAVPGPFRSPRSASTLSVERSFHLRPVGGASVLDAGVFDAASYRVGSTTDSSNHVLVNLVGVRLRLLSANGGVSSVRLDLGYPVASSALVHRQLYVSLAAGSLFDVGRQRDGTRQ